MFMNEAMVEVCGGHAHRAGDALGRAIKRALTQWTQVVPTEAGKQWRFLKVEQVQLRNGYYAGSVSPEFNNIVSYSLYEFFTGLVHHF